jgi:hypothetical protein
MDVAGTWRLVVQSPMGRQNLTLVLREDAEGLAGTQVNDSNQRAAEIFEASLSGDRLAWKVTLKEMKMTLAFDTTVADGELTGKVKAGFFGKFNVSGRREA